MKNKLIEVLKIQSESYNQWRMFAYIIRQLNEIGCKYYVYNGCIYATKGKTDFYPCIVSHMDTVHSITDELKVLEVKGNLFGFNSAKMEQTGIGGDDKVGIYIALESLRKFDNIKAVFFRDEEIGCDGSYDPHFTFFDDCGFILQCDRKGYGDFITSASGTKLSGKDFQKDVKQIIKDYGYSFTKGMMTDVMALKESGILCSMANISCGYYNPHSSKEYVNIADVQYCMEMVFDIIYKLQGNYYYCKYERPKPVVYTKTFKSFDRYEFLKDDPFWTTKIKPMPKEQLCECCQEKAVLTYVSAYNIEMCDKCISDYVTKSYGT